MQVSRVTSLCLDPRVLYARNAAGELIGNLGAEGRGHPEWEQGVPSSTAEKLRRCSPFGAWHVAAGGCGEQPQQAEDHTLHRPVGQGKMPGSISAIFVAVTPMDG